MEQNIEAVGLAALGLFSGARQYENFSRIRPSFQQRRCSRRPCRSTFLTGNRSIFLKPIAAATARSLSVGAPGSGADLGPVANRPQYERVIAMIEKGIGEGAHLLAGGAVRPAHLERGFFVMPTVFGGVTSHMAVAREEIFGPVLVVIPFEDDADAIRIANDTEYGLSGYVWSRDRERALAVAGALRTGMVHLNGASLDTAAPFGGYGKSGNGREWGVFGLEEFLEVKSIYGGAS